MPRRRVTHAIADAQVQLPRARPVVFKPGIVLPVQRLFIWIGGALRFFFGNMLDIVLGRDSIQRRAVRLRRVFEDIGGTFAKLGQQLSLRADILPYAYCAELAHTLDQVPSFPTSEAIAIIERSLGRRLDEMFTIFDPDPIGSASLACVWQATLKTGERVAVKVRRPDIGRMIAADLRVLGWLLNMAEMLTLIRPGSTGHVLRDLRTILFDELNFRAESRYTELFRRRSEQRGEVTAPRVYFRYCSDDVLVSELVSGIWMWELMAAVDNDDVEFLLKASAMGIEPKSLARKLVGITHWQALEEPFHHADPHPANLIVLPNNRICFIDFGAVGRFSTRTRKAWRELQYHMMTGNISRLVSTAFHFLGELPPMDVGRLNETLTAVFSDFVYAMISKDAQWWERSSAQIWLHFVEVAQEFGLSVSVEMLQLFRATLLYDSIVTRLDKNINFAHEYGLYAREAAKIARERMRKSRGRRLTRLTDMDYLGLEQIGDSAGQFFFRLQRSVEEPLIHFRNIVGKISYAATLLLRLGYLAVTAVAIAVLADTTSMNWYGHHIDWAALIAAETFSRWWIELTAIVIALVLIRRIVVRLSLPDQRVGRQR